MRIDTSEPSLTALFNKGQVGLIRTEFMRKDDVIANTNELLEIYKKENAALAAENERLKAETVKQIEAALPPVEAYIAKLEAENERLRKAGDAMAAIIRPPAHGPGEWDGEYEAWLAAKGVQP